MVEQLYHPISEADAAECKFTLECLSQGPHFHFHLLTFLGAFTIRRMVADAHRHRNKQPSTRLWHRAAGHQCLRQLQ